MQTVADVFGITRASIASWESGNSNPDHKKLIELANLFECSVQFLLTGTNATETASQDLGVRFISFTDLIETKNRTFTNQIVTPLHSSPSSKAFATRYPGRNGFNWSPTSVPAGSILIIDPSATIKPTSTVLVQLKKNSEIFLAQMRQTPGNKNYFLVDDENHTQIEPDHRLKIIGVILEWQLSGKL
jgi:transcriptional regulator with XRE-family HTH domain